MSGFLDSDVSWGCQGFGHLLVGFAGNVKRFWTVCCDGEEGSSNFWTAYCDGEEAFQFADKSESRQLCKNMPIAFATGASVLNGTKVDPRGQACNWFLMETIV